MATLRGARRLARAFPRHGIERIFGRAVDHVNSIFDRSRPRSAADTPRAEGAGRRD